MSDFHIARWAAWAPGIEGVAAWREWARSPHLPSGEAVPSLAFMSPLRRRRCDRLSRMMLEVANACCDEQSAAEVCSVFATRLGSIRTTNRLLSDLALDKPVSPALFSHSVHNTPAAHFSIACRNRQASISIAAGAETFSHALIESMWRLNAQPPVDVLLVVANEAVPEPLSLASDHDAGVYALALLLVRDGPEPAFRLRAEPRIPSGHREAIGLPQTLAFLHWWLSDATELRLPAAARTWVWSRGDS